MASEDNNPSASIEQNLEELANRTMGLSKAALIRQHMPQIEAAQTAGATNTSRVADANPAKDV